MKVVNLIFIITLFSSCIYEDSLHPVVPQQLINANSAKVWVKTKDFNNDGVNKSPQLNELRTAYIFYEDGSFQEQQMIHLGSKNGRYGYYAMNISDDRKDTSFVLNYHGPQEITFSVDYIDPKQMKLSTSEFTWQLESLKPPNID